MSFVKPLRLTLVAAAAALAACDDSPLAPVLPPTVATVEVTPLSPTMARGTDLQLRATPKATDGRPLLDRSVTWTSLTPSLVTVSATGVVRGLAAGTATVRATSETVTRDVAIEVSAAAVVGIVPSTTALTLDEHAEDTVTAVLRNALGENVDGALTWTSLSPLVAMVNGGAVTALSEGSATIRVSAGALSADIEVTVRPVFGGDLLFAMRDGDFGAFRIYKAAGADYAARQRLLEFNGMSNPELSPDGMRLLFACPNSGPAICVANADGSNIVTLTDGDLTYEDQPTWSPDGSKIAFRRYSQIGTPGPWNAPDVWTMNADGTGQVNLTSDARGQHWPTWTAANGGQIAFVQDSIVDGYETSRIAVMSSTGANRRFVTAAGMSIVERPRWSPDGSTLVFTRAGDSFDGEIRLVTVATGVERGFLAAPLPTGGQWHPTFSPNGRYVVFSSAHEAVGGAVAQQIYTARADGTDVRRRSTGAVGKMDFAWSATQ